ncbi:MAG: (2Fe-2S)-binding protein [Vicinamibacteria bacterium]|jgi:hypothetical protein
MDECCDASVPDTPQSRLCAACGQAGRTVGLITLKALLRPAALERLSVGDHYFCATAACPVVYFGAGDVFPHEDVLVPVFQKEPPGRRTVCYCFDVGEDQVRAEVETTGASVSAERITGLVRDERCACELRNPQGGCCLGNVRAIARSALGAPVA